MSSALYCPRVCVVLSSTRVHITDVWHMISYLCGCILICKLIDPRYEKQSKSRRLIHVLRAVPLLPDLGLRMLSGDSGSLLTDTQNEPQKKLLQFLRASQESGLWSLERENR